MARSYVTAPGLLLALALAAGGLAGLAHADGEPAGAGPSYFGLAFHGAYVERAADGALDCNPYGQALRVSFRGDIIDPQEQFEAVEYGEIRMILPGEWRHRERLRYGVNGGWFAWDDEPMEGASHEAMISRWVCAGLGCRTAGDGEIRLHVEPDGDVTLLDFHWRENFAAPQVLHAGGETGPVRLGHCPALE